MKNQHRHEHRTDSNPTAAFPAILDNAIRKNIVQMYQEIPTTFQLWTTKGLSLIHISRN